MYHIALNKRYILKFYVLFVLYVYYFVYLYSCNNNSALNVSFLILYTFCTINTQVALYILLYNIIKCLQIFC